MKEFKSLICRRYKTFKRISETLSDAPESAIKLVHAEELFEIVYFYPFLTATVEEAERATN